MVAALAWLKYIQEYNNLTNNNNTAVLCCTDTYF